MTKIEASTIRPDLHFGARVGGVTRESLEDAAVRSRLNALFDEYGLLVFEGIEPSPQMQVALSEIFGPLKDHPSRATPRAGRGEFLGLIEMRHEPNSPGSTRIGDAVLASWLPWHFDHCYNDRLNRGGVLRALEIPPEGGRTGFVDGIALYHALPPALRERIEGEAILYAMDVVIGNLRFGRPADFEQIAENPTAASVMAEYADRPRALHPAVWTRPSGEKVLHVSPWMAKGIAGREDAAGEALLEEVSREIVSAAEHLSYFHPWAYDEMVIWDNWRVLHSVSGMPPQYGRCMHRTTIEGDYGLGRFESTHPAPADLG